MTTTTEKKNTFTRDLPVELTETELLLYGKLMAEKHQQIGALEEKKKTIVKEYNAQISSLANDQSRLAEARVKGTELRPVLCYERWHAGVIEIVRCDTNEVVDSRPATLADRQESIPGLEDDDEGGTEAAPSAAEAEAEEVGQVVESSVGDQVFTMSAEDAELDGATEREPSEPGPGDKVTILVGDYTGSIGEVVKVEDDGVLRIRHDDGEELFDPTDVEIRKPDAKAEGEAEPEKKGGKKSGGRPRGKKKR